ncbi:MAG: transglutaminase-like domain-containing protein [Salinispira sp.]
MLFAGRLLLYAALMLLPIFHPALAHYADAAFLLRIALFMPLGAILGWVKVERKQRRILHLLSFVLPLLILPFFSVTTVSLDIFLFAQCAYWSTWLMFHRRCARIFYIDLSYFIFVIYRLLNIRSQESQAFTALALSLLLTGFILYTILLYRLKFGAQRPRAGECAAGILVPLTLAVLTAFFLPNDFIQDLRVFNNADNIINPPLRPLSDPEDISEIDGDSGNNGNGDDAGVFILSPNAWGSRNGTGNSGENGTLSRQHMVMIVKSPVGTLYLADEYFNNHDPLRGFYSDPDFHLNRLTKSQYLETWQNPSPLPLRNRQPVHIEVYSTISDKVSSYQPYRIEPTIFNTDFYPLTYTYRSQSRVSNISILQRFPESRAGAAENGAAELLPVERQELLPYLELSLPEEFRQQYRMLADELASPNSSFRERIAGILQHYRTYQYELGFTDDVSTAAVSAFLFENKSGDCTEFSNSAAILGRMMGIPSRVVTGYLVSEGFRNASHLQALAELQHNYPPIAHADISDLYLVTNVHRHSWAQFYLPIYGWVDIETTSFAIPPAGDMDPNNLDLVIPDLRDRSARSQSPIPWGILLRLTVITTLGALLVFYGIRWSRLVRLIIISRKNNRNEHESICKALYRLLIIRLQARGYALKNIDATPAEYAEMYPELRMFAQVYTALIYRTENTESGIVPESSSENIEQLRKEYRRLLKEHHRFTAILRELFSLKDMRYLL